MDELSATPRGMHVRSPEPPSPGSERLALLDVVVVAYRSKALLRACLDSLASHRPTTGGMRVHVVDNASGDGTAEMVAHEFPDVELYRLSTNSGFSAANNLAMRQSNAPFVLVLNPDTELRAGVLDHMLALLQSRPDLGMAGCRLETLDGTFDHAAKRSFPTPAAALAHFTGIGRIVSRRQLSAYRAPGVDERGIGEVDAINGAFMIVRRKALEDVGLFDEGYWLYMEDLDWCARFWSAGWRVLYDGRVTALHHKGGTAGTYRRFRQNAAFHRGMGRFYRKYQSGDNIIQDVAVYAGIGLKLAGSSARSVAIRRVRNWREPWWRA